MTETSFLDMGWPAYRESLRKNAQEERIPLLGTFELTPLCNFDCKMCYVHLKPEKMRETGRLRTTQEWLDLGRQARDAGMLTLLLTGGEVMTRPDFAEIYTGLSEMGLVISIFSNGYLLPEEVLRMLQKCPPVQFRITLYGASNGTYEHLCGVPDGYDRVMENIHRLQAADIDVDLAFTATTYNYLDLPLVQKISDEVGVPLRVAAELFSPIRGAEKDMQFLQLNQSQMKKLLEIDTHADDAKANQPQPSKSEMLKLMQKAKEGQFYSSPLEICGSRRCGFWMTWNGNMSMCAMISSIYTKPFDVGFSEAWRELCAQMEKLQFPDLCKRCEYMPFCHSCPGKREADAGDPERICFLHCERAKAQMAQVFKKE